MLTLNVRTDQEAFDKVVAHLAAMDGQSARYDADAEDVLCLYRGPEGRRCAVGALIDDDDIAIYEKWSVTRLSDDGIVDFGMVRKSLLSGLQIVHDNAFNWEKGGFVGWEELALIATDSGLDGSAALAKV